MPPGWQASKLHAEHIEIFELPVQASILELQHGQRQHMTGLRQSFSIFQHDNIGLSQQLQNSATAVQVLEAQLAASKAVTSASETR